MKILVINAGSSSLKYQLMDPDTNTVFAKGLCERIGIDGRLTHKIPAKDFKQEFEIPMPTHAEAIAAVIDKLTCPECGVVSSMKEIADAEYAIVSVPWATTNPSASSLCCSMAFAITAILSGFMFVLSICISAIPSS